MLTLISSMVVLVPCLVLIFLSTKIYSFIINPVSLYCVMWLGFTFFACQGFWGIYKPSLETIGFILIGTMCFSLVSMFTFLLNKEKKKFHLEPEPIETDKKYSLLVIINIMAIVWLIPFVLKTVPMLMNGEWAIVRMYYLEANTINVVFNTRQALVCQWIVFPIFYVTTIISAYLVSQKKTNIYLALISLSGIILIVLATAGRNALFKFLLFYILAYLMNSARIKEVIEKIKSINLFTKLIILLGILAIIFISSKRSLSDDTSALQNAFYYFTGPIVYLNYIIDNPGLYALNENLMFGRATFGFITTPIEIGYSMLFGYDYAGADNIITSYVGQYISFSPVIKGNAVSTAMYPFMKDFGVLGIILGPAIYAWIVNFAYVNSHKSMFWNCLSLYMLYTVFFSEWQYELLFPQSFSIMMFLYLFVGKKTIRGRVYRISD